MACQNKPKLRSRPIAGIIVIAIMFFVHIAYCGPEKKSENFMKKIIASHYEAEQYDHWIWMKRGDRYYINGLTKKED